MARHTRNSGADPAPIYPTWAVLLISLLPAAVAVVITIVLILGARLTFKNFSDPDSLNSLGMLVVFILAGLVVGYGVRYLLPADGPPVDEGDTDHNRGKIARWVVVASTVGIFVTGLALIIVLRDSPDRAYSVFTATLPVFSTWVGTVLAFYFSNESFRQASQASQSLFSSTGPAGGGEPVTKPGIMVPFGTIPRIELNTEQMAGKQPREAAGLLKMKMLVDAFPQGAGRLVIFDDKKIPIYVLRRSALPTEVGTGDTLQSYLATGTNEEAARNFTWTSSTASLADARRTVELRRVSDLFITDQGGSSEPTIGWVPDENLRRQ